MKTQTTERLAAALEAAGAPPTMIAEARAGRYDDFRSPRAFPLHDLVADARRAGLFDIVRRTLGGEFDATREEADAWAQSEEGSEVLRGIRRPK